MVLRSLVPGAGRRATQQNRIWLTRLVVALSLGCLSTTLADAAAPTNDVCSGAELIPSTAGATRPYLTAVTDILEATNPGDPDNSCQSFVDRGIWYRFTPTSTAFFTISTFPQLAPGTTVPDTVLAIYTSIGGCNGPFVQLINSIDFAGCNDDISDDVLHSSITTLLLADATYYILAWRYQDPDDPTPPAPAQAQMQLQFVRTTPPQNDLCSRAQELQLNVPVIGTTIGATNDYQLSSAACFVGVGHITPSAAELRDVVYGFTAPVSGSYSFKVLNLSVVNDFVLYLVPECPLGTSPITITNCIAAANRNIGGAEEIAGINLAAQTRVYVVVDENLYALDPYWQGGNFRLEVTLSSRETEPNDSPTNATALVCGMEASADPRNDVDFFALGTYPAGSRLFAFIDAGAANLSRDFDLRATTATDVLEFDDSDNTRDFGNFAPNICGLPLPHEPVFLRVNFANTRYAAEPYRVYAVVQPPIKKAVWETEPNAAFGSQVLPGASYYRGTLAEPAPSTDVDTFTFEAESGELIYIGLDCNPNRNNHVIDARLALLDNEGNTLIAVDNSNPEISASTNRVPGSLTANEPYSPGEALVFRMVNDGLYHVQVSLSPYAVATNSTGDYLLSVSKGCASAPFDFRIASITRLAPDHYRLVFDGVPGQAYRLLFSTNLTSWNALPVSPQTADATGRVVFDDTTTPPDVRRFYRGISP